MQNSCFKVVGWTGQTLPDQSLWYKSYAMTPVLPESIKVTFEIKIMALAYPLAGFIGFIEKDQKPPQISTFDPLEYPYLLHTWSMSPRIEDVGEQNPRVNPKKKSNVMYLRVTVDGKRSDKQYRGRYIDMEYMNNKNEMHTQSFNFVAKSLRLYINFGAFPNKAYIVHETPFDFEQIFDEGPSQI